MQGPGSFLDVATYPPGATETQARIVIDGDRGAIFVYTAGNPLGSLVGSWAATAGTDPYGNVYPQGFNGLLGVIEGITFLGTDFILNSNGLVFYTGTPAANNVAWSLASAFTDQFGNSILDGFAIYIPTNFPNTWDALNIDVGFSTQAFGEIAFYQSTNNQAGPWSVAWQMILKDAGIELTNVQFSFDVQAFFGAGFIAQSAGTAIEVDRLTTVTSTPLVKLIGLGTTDNMLGFLVSGDTNSRLRVDADGEMQWGPGNAGVDTRLFRSAAGVLTCSGITNEHSSGVAESWQTLAIPSGWSAHGASAAASFRYKLLAENNMVLLAVDLNTPSSAPANGTVLATLPTGYRPTKTTGHIVLAGTPVTQTPHFDINTAGQILAEHIAANDVVSGFQAFALN